ncbi:MAG: hypothetical protein C4521_00855 [Actinobacteria bacterium]|nr:MAG: hypothetical protein C4521_00855 [Actinomycetota bacterium]
MTDGVLLHVCCGPCAIHPVSVLGARSLVAAYYYNPNIHPAEEYARRLSTAKQYFEQIGLRFVSGPYIPEQYFSAIGSDVTKPARCEHCYELRLSATAAAAAELGFGSFATTLLVSPYQDREAILAAGRRAAQTNHVDFIEQDFTSGYRAAQQESRERGMYRQKYCGCSYSKDEADEGR